MSNRINYNSIPQNGLVLDMPLNGNANARVGSNGTATNMTWVDSEKGYTSKVGSFNGSSSNIDTVNTGLPFGNSARILNFWAKINIIGNDKYFMSYGNGAVGQFFSPSVTINGKIGFMGYAADLETTTVAIAGVWQMYTYIYDGSVLKILLNGINIGSATISLNTATTYNFIQGARNYNGTITNYINADIGLVKFYNRALSTEEIHNLKLEGDRLFGDKPNYPQLLRGLKAYYDFKGGSLSNLVDGTNATNNGAVVTTDHLGRSGNAYSFNGSSSYINTPNGPYNFGTGNFTISMIVKRNTAGTVQTILSNLTASSVTGIAIYFSALNQLIFETWSGGVNHIIQSSSTFSSLSTNYHIVCIKNGASLFSYIDGVLLTGITFGGGNLNISNAVIGAFGKYTFNNSGFWNGTISQLTIQNQALNASEVKELYNLTSKEYIYPFSKSSILSLEKGLVMHLDSNGVDLSGNGNNGIPTVVTPTRRGQSEGGIYNGSSSYITLPSTIFTSGGTNIFSFSTSIVFNGTNTNQGILMGATTGTGVYIYLSANRLIFTKVGIVDLIIAYTPIIGKLIKLDCIADNTGMRILVDNKIITSNTNTSLFTNTTSTFALGSYISNSVLQAGWYFNGNIYEPKIYNRNLLTKEMKQINYLNYIN